MKIILLENGEETRLETILGDNPAGELDELLGGPVSFRELTPSLQLVTRAYGEDLPLPIRYRCDTNRTAFPIYGNCAVVRVVNGSQLCDVSEKVDIATVCRMIRPV